MSAHGCFNRAPYRQHMKVADGHWDDGLQRIPKLVSIPFRMSTECNYTLTELGKSDKHCEGCTWKKHA